MPDFNVFFYRQFAEAILQGVPLQINANKVEDYRRDIAMMLLVSSDQLKILIQFCIKNSLSCNSVMKQSC